MWFTDADQVLCETSVKNGGKSKREFPENLLKEGEEDWNKWRTTPFCPVKGNINWTVLKFATSITFCTLGFKSANDDPVNDPTSVEIYVWTA